MSMDKYATDPKRVQRDALTRVNTELQNLRMSSEKTAAVDTRIAELVREQRELLEALQAPTT